MASRFYLADLLWCLTVGVAMIVASALKYRNSMKDYDVPSSPIDMK
jgi:hypothetical protein